MEPIQLAGRLLVALPVLTDANFAHSVILVLAHDPDDGAVGVVLNRPSDTALGDTLPHWEARAAHPRVIFVGGPVGLTAAIGVARGASDRSSEGWAPVAGRLGTVDLAAAPDEVATEIEAVRVFSGYAGWGPGQIEAEIDEGAWLIIDGAPDDVLTADPARLWRLVLRRQGGRTAWLANLPPDPRVN